MQTFDSQIRYALYSLTRGWLMKKDGVGSQFTNTHVFKHVHVRKFNAMVDKNGKDILGSLTGPASLDHTRDAVWVIVTTTFEKVGAATPVRNY